MARVLRFAEIGGPGNLRLEDEAPGTPGAGEVRVRMRAAGLNRAEWLFLQGRYLVQPALPSRIGMEGAGIIDAVGPGVADRAIGEEVCITPNLPVDRYGVLGEYALVPASALAPKPPGLGFEEAAAVWMAFPTAYGGLVEYGGLRRGGGQTVVVSAAGSGVGLPAIQIAKAHGATVIATSRTAAKRDSLIAAGADHVIATETEDFVARVHDLTGGRGFDIAFDPIAGPFLEQLAAAAAVEAVIVLYGILSMEPTGFPLIPALAKGLTVRGFHVAHHLFQHPDRLARAAADIEANLRAGIYRPIIDRVFPLEQAADAYRYMGANAQRGKIIVRCG
jgi:NADPH:quinone reductase-like Zn-dependent oxidoreductase